MGQGPSAPGPPGTKFQVIGAGMPRTGTKSFTEAMRILLQGPPHDCGAQSIGGTRATRRRWHEIMYLGTYGASVAEKAKLKWLLAECLEGFAATSDVPGVYFTKELLELYPDAIVIATTRTADGWWRSMLRMEGMISPWWVQALIWPLPRLGDFRLCYRSLLRMRAKREGQYWGPESLEMHNDYLRKIVPKERLFFYECRDGWEPLCKILGKPIPDAPFPHENDPNAANKMWWGIMATAAGVWIGIGAIVGCSAYMLQPYVKRFM